MCKVYLGTNNTLNGYNFIKCFREYKEHQKQRSYAKVMPFLRKHQLYI